MSRAGIAVCAATELNKASPLVLEMLKLEMVPPCAFVVNARLVFSSISSQHGAIPKVGSAPLMIVRLPAFETEYEETLSEAASLTISCPFLVKANP